MPGTFSLAQQAPPTEILAPAADAAGRTGDWINTKHIGKAFIVAHITQGNAATVALSLLQASAADGTGSKAGPTVNIWSNLDTATSDALVARTAAASYTTDAAVKNKIVIFEVPPEALDQANGFQFITISTGASNAANITQAMLIPYDLRDQGSSPPTRIA